MDTIFEKKDCIKALEAVPIIPIVERNKKSIITIMIPTCKRSLMLKETLDSIFSQKTERDYCVTVVDNNPERDDDTETLIKDYYLSKDNLSYYKNAKNVGMTGNWNRLFQICKSEYMIMLHDDDVLLSGFIDQIISCIDLVPNLSVVNSGKLIWFGDESKKETEPVYNKLIIFSKESNYPYFNFGAPSGCLFRVNDVIDVGGFDEATYPAIDYVLIEKLCLLGKTVCKMDGYSMLYRTGRNESSKLDTLIGWLKIDNQIKDELGRILHLNKSYVSIVKYFELKFMMWAIEKKMFGDNIKYMPHNLIFIGLHMIYRFFCNKRISNSYTIKSL